MSNKLEPQLQFRDCNNKVMSWCVMMEKDFFVSQLRTFFATRSSSGSITMCISNSLTLFRIVDDSFALTVPQKIVILTFLYEGIIYAFFSTDAPIETYCLDCFCSKKYGSVSTFLPQYGSDAESPEFR